MSCQRVVLLNFLDTKVNPNSLLFPQRERERGGGGGEIRQSSREVGRGGRQVVRWCWINFQCRGVPLIWIIVGPLMLAVGAGWGCLDIFFSRLSFLVFFSLSQRWADID